MPTHRPQSTPRLFRIFLLVTAVICGASLPGAVTTSAFAGPLFSDGHGDIGLAYDGTDLHLELHAHAGAVIGGEPLASDTEFEPGDVDILVNLSDTVSDSVFPQLGLPEGTRVFYLTPFESVGSPFLGISSEELVSADWSAIHWTLSSVTGPGVFSLLELDSFGGVQASYGIGSALPLVIGAHNHFLYLFTAPGTYDVTFNVDGTLVDGGGGSNLRSTAGTFRFVVPVPEPSLPMALGSLALVAGIQKFLRRQTPRRNP